MALEHESDSPLAKAVQKAGSQSAFGRVIGKRQSVVHGWLKDGVKFVPSDFVLKVEAALGIPCWEQNPEIYPPEKFAPSPGSRPDETSAEDGMTSAGVRDRRDGGPLAGLRS